MTIENRPTQPELPAARPLRSEDWVQPQSAVYRRVARTARDPLADLVEEVVTRPDDPRRE
jgi:hypothetical protein